jgi:hypothetical protein
MESAASACSDTREMSTATVLSATINPNATKMKDMMHPSEPVSASRELSSSEASARKSPGALPTPTTTPSAVSATQDSNSIKTTSVSESTSSFLSALPTHDSTESHVPVTLVSSNRPSTPALPAHLELNGMDKSVTRFLLRPAPMDTSSMRISCSVSPQLPHAERTLTSMELLASALLASTSSMESASHAPLELSSTVPSVPPLRLSHLQPRNAVPTRSTLMELVSATQVYI